MLANYTQGIDVLEEALEISKKKSFPLVEAHVLTRLGKIYPHSYAGKNVSLIVRKYHELDVLSLSAEYLEQTFNSMYNYADKNLEAQAYIYLAETFSAQGFNLKAYLVHFLITICFEIQQI